MAMQVIIDLPESDQFDAEVFGLWLGTVLHDNDELDTKIGTISVRRAGA